MTLVVDASVAVKWFFREPRSDAALRILRSSELLIAPDVVVSEAVNVAWRKRRLGEIEEAQGHELASLLPPTFAILVSSAELAGAAFALSVRLDHPAYDCFYLALAEEHGADLATDDARFLSAARKAKVARVKPLSSY